MNDVRPRQRTEMYFEVLLEEYKGVREATLTIEGRVDTLTQVMVGAFGAVITVFSSLAIAKSLWLLPMASMVFSVFGLMLGFRLRQIRLLTEYEALVLKPKIQRVVRDGLDDSTLSVLEWQPFWRKSLFKSGFLGWILGGAQGVATVLFPIGTSAGFLVTYLLMSAGSSGTSNTELIVFVVGLGLWLLMLISDIFVGLEGVVDKARRTFEV